MNLQDALKYTTDTVRTLLAELQKPEHNEHRWGTDQSKTLRSYLADALQDAVAQHTDPTQQKSLETQAALLRQPEQHVVVRDGRVRAGKFGIGEILPLLAQFNQQVAQERGFGPVTVRQNKKGQVSIAPNPTDNAEIGTGVKILPRSLSRYLHLLVTGEPTLPNEPLIDPHPLVDAIQKAAPEEVDATHPSEKPKK